MTQLIADSHNSCRLEHPFTVDEPLALSFDISVLHDVGMEPRFENKALRDFAFTGSENPDSSAIFKAQAHDRWLWLWVRVRVRVRARVEGQVFGFARIRVIASLIHLNLRVLFIGNG